MKRYVYYVGVGELPKLKAQELVRETKLLFLEWWPNRGEWLFLPTRRKELAGEIRVFEV